jgi:hypothetical protein
MRRSSKVDGSAKKWWIGQDREIGQATAYAKGTGKGRNNIGSSVRTNLDLVSACARLLSSTCMQSIMLCRSVEICIAAVSGAERNVTAMRVKRAV